MTPGTDNPCGCGDCRVCLDVWPSGRGQVRPPVVKADLPAEAVKVATKAAGLFDNVGEEAKA